MDAGYTEVAMRKIILLNGPPRSGKDTVGRMLVRMLAHNGEALAFAYKFATELKDMTHRLFATHTADPEAFESVKDRPSDKFMGLSPRKAYIAVSERLMKPMLGDEIFGRLLADRLQTDWGFTQRPIYFPITDSGFESEARVLVDRFGAGNVLLVRIHRPGTSFDGDSRSYINVPGVHAIELHNGGTLADLERAVQPLARAILEGNERELVRIES